MNGIVFKGNDGQLDTYQLCRLIKANNVGFKKIDGLWIYLYSQDYMLLIW